MILSQIPDQICGYPIPGWHLECLEVWREPGHPKGWKCTLRREPLARSINWAHTRVTGFSDLGPLEAWEMSCRMALRDDRKLEQFINDSPQPKQGNDDG